MSTFLLRSLVAAVASAAVAAEPTTMTIQTPAAPTTADPQPSQDGMEMVGGTLLVAGQGRLVVLINGQEQSFLVSPSVEIQKDGQRVRLAALSRHDQLTMTGRRGDGTKELVIERINARSAY